MDENSVVVNGIKFINLTGETFRMLYDHTKYMGNTVVFNAIPDLPVPTIVCDYNPDNENLHGFPLQRLELYIRDPLPPKTRNTYYIVPEEILRFLNGRRRDFIAPYGRYKNGSAIYYRSFVA